MVGGFILDATIRQKTGKGDARRLRNEHKIPAVVYGNGEPLGLVLDHFRVSKALENEAFYSHILTLNVNGAEEKVILKALQRHPFKPVVMHMDFQRVSASERIRVHVPLHFINQEIAVGVKKGGAISHHMVDVEVSCLPDQLPEFLEVDMAALDIGQFLHLSDLTVPEGVEVLALHQGADHDLAVASVHGVKSGEASV
ncbi:MAG: hypothetical protein RLZZ226_1371 [Pseudomonadota bacterium]|jgi:large subunit ribosomal protein L25